MIMPKTLTAAATAAVLLSGCAVVPETEVARDLVVGRIQGAVNEYCKKSDDLRLAYRIIVAEVTSPHVVRIDCAKASILGPPT